MLIPSTAASASTSLGTVISVLTREQFVVPAGFFGGRRKAPLQ